MGDGLREPNLSKLAGVLSVVNEFSEILLVLGSWTRRKDS